MSSATANSNGPDGSIEPDKTALASVETRELISQEVKLWLTKPHESRPSLEELIVEILELEGKRVDTEWSEQGWNDTVKRFAEQERETWFEVQVKARGYSKSPRVHENVLKRLQASCYCGEEAEVDRPCHFCQARDALVSGL